MSPELPTNIASKNSERISRREFLRRTGAVCLVGGAAVSGLSAWVGAETKPTVALQPAYRVLGRTGLKVSTLSFGGALGHGCNPVERQVTRQRLMLEALDHGVNLFDIYKDERIGEYACLAPYGDKALVLYKTEIMSAQGTRQEVDAALKAMNRDRLDLVMPHGYPRAWDAEVNPEDWNSVIEALEEMVRLKENGKVGYVGYVTHPVRHLKKIILEHNELVDVIMVRYGPFERFDEFKEVIDLAHERNMGVIVFKTLDGAEQCYRERMWEWRMQEKTWARIMPLMEQGLRPAQACIRYALNQAGVHTVLVGIRRSTELRQDVAAAISENLLTDALPKRDNIRSQFAKHI